MQLTDKVVLITGASRGIGQAIAKLFACHGAIVIGSATTQEGADHITKALKHADLKGEGIKLDVTNTESLDETYHSIQEKFGAPEILINNAAITRDNLFLRMKPDEWDAVISTNLNAVFHLSKLCLRPMLKAKWGRIISISSIVGVTGNAGQANYAAAKAGVIGFSKSLAQEVASRNITINVIAPGFIDTDMTRALTKEQRENIFKGIPAQRLGQPEEVANAALFLASNYADYMTGQTLHVNGGMLMP